MSVNSFDDLLNFIEIDQHSNNKKQNICFVNYTPEGVIIEENLTVDYEISYDFLLYLINNKFYKLIFTSCIFNFDLNINEEFAYKISNKNDVPDEFVRNECFGNLNFEFRSCTFKKRVNFDNFDYNGKLKFRHCFFNIIKINNATFNDLFEISFSEIQSIAVFNKVDFNANCVFTKTKFFKNCVFIYCTFEKQGVFSRAKFMDSNDKPTALDLSQCIVNGQLTFFETQIENYTAIRIDSKDEKKFDELTKSGEHIPIQNKRETFRIIKNQLIEQNNLIDAEKYAKLEKQVFLEEKNLDAIFEASMLKTLKILLSDYFVLKLNKYSNNFKTSWSVALLFVLTIGLLSHSLLSISENYHFYEYTNIIKLFNLTDFSLVEKDASSKFYVMHFFTKIAIGYGIYQFIQAFRKFR